MKNKDGQLSAREPLSGEYDWDEEDQAFISTLNDERAAALVKRMKNASFYRSLFLYSKYSIFVAFIIVYTVRYFHYQSLSIVIQLIIIPIGISAIFSFFKLRRVESNTDYKTLFIEEG
ncbi:hypothetical protein [Pedobacter sp. L105]|uniref:hypothetical protein n=1 Tax=Pedobacter sp. L105 TaxID=1641871 RepID=UPI00131EB014|nr:hypothetical protein [Pedobacter sp. L105]